MHKLDYIRRNTYRRNDKIFKQVYGKKTLSKKFSFYEINLYSKIKTVLNIEIACLFIFLLLRTNISANAVTISGFFWTLAGVILINLSDNIFVYSGIFILFLKLVPDYIDGQLASFRGETSLTGSELDSWAGNVGKSLILAGFFLYSFENSPIGQIDFFYIIFLVIIIFSLADLRLFLSKFNKVYYDKFLKTHVKKKQSKKKSSEFINNNFIVKFFKFLHYDGGTKYTDFLLILIILEDNLNFKIFYIFAIIWSITFSLAFFKSLYLTLKR